MKMAGATSDNPLYCFILLDAGTWSISLHVKLNASILPLRRCYQLSKYDTESRNDGNGIGGVHPLYFVYFETDWFHNIQSLI